jgi:hypothetical protein
MNWLWSYLTFQRGTRLITGLSGSRMEDMFRHRTSAFLFNHSLRSNPGEPILACSHQ